MKSAADRWGEDLASWAIPEEILARAPEEPWGLNAELFTPPSPEEADTPSRDRGLEVLDEGGSVIDVGAGGGAASLPLVPRASRIVAVDSSEAMLESFARHAGSAGVEHREVLGAWPGVADAAGTADVVVCHHVLYNVGDLVPFIVALTRAARRRVVVEITTEHPRARLNPLWRRFHGIDRPQRPTADDALAVLREAGLGVQQQRWTHAPRPEPHDPSATIAFVRRSLCLTPDRDAEVASALKEIGYAGPRALATIWWNGSA